MNPNPESRIEAAYQRVLMTGGLVALYMLVIVFAAICGMVARLAS